MRMLKFAVEGQQLAKRGDFTGVTAGSKGNVCPLPPPAEGEGESHSGEERL